MANNNTVTVTLRAKDEASKVIQSFKSGLTSSLTAANILANSIQSGLTAAMKGLTNSLKEASNIELNNITAAGTYVALTGKSFGEAEKVVNKLNESLAKTAATLPGTTQGYKDIALGIMDNVIPAFQDASGALDEPAMLKALEEMTVGFGVLGAASNVASADINKFASKFLGGSSISELKQLLFAEANPAFLSIVEKKLAETGKTLAELTHKERALILKEVQSQLVTPEVIAAASGSLGGMFEGIKSNLFEQSTGVFGLMRDLDKDTEGAQTVFQSIKRIFGKLFGEGGVFPELLNILKDAGIDIDPMKGLASALGKLGIFLDKFRAWLSVSSLEDFNLFNWNKLLADSFNWIVTQTTTILKNPELPSLIFDGIANALAGLANLIINIDWLSVINLLLSLRQLVINLVKEFWARIWEGVKVFGGIVGESISGLFNSVANKFNEFKGWASDKLNGVKTALNGFILGLQIKIAQFKALLGMEDTTVYSSSMPLPNNYTGANNSSLMKAISKELTYAPGGSKPVLANSSETILTRNQYGKLLDYINKAEEYISNFISPDNLNLGSLFNPSKFFSRDKGESASFNPNIEVKGFNPNSSQTVQPYIPPTNDISLDTLKGLSNQPTSNNVSFGNIIINSNSSDPKQVAQEVIIEINRQFLAYRQNNIAAPVI